MSENLGAFEETNNILRSDQLTLLHGALLSIGGLFAHAMSPQAVCSSKRVDYDNSTRWRLEHQESEQCSIHHHVITLPLTTCPCFAARCVVRSIIHAFQDTARLTVAHLFSTLLYKILITRGANLAEEGVPSLYTC